MAKTVGQKLRPLEGLPSDEVKVADERHVLSVSDKPEDLGIVLTRPLVTCHDSEITKVRICIPLQHSHKSQRARDE